MSSIVWTIAPIWLPLAPRLVTTFAPVSTAFLMRAIPDADSRTVDAPLSAACPPRAPAALTSSEAVDASRMATAIWLIASAWAPTLEAV